MLRPLSRYERLPILSDKKDAARQTKYEAKYGGADRPWAWIEEYPISLIIVGRKAGSAAKVA
jgi:hypothetical protein